MRHAVRASTLGALILSLLLASGCSSIAPVQTGRSGLFDHLQQLEAANAHKHHRSPANYSATETEDGAEASPAESAAPLSGDFSKVTFRWPLEHVKVTSLFGKRGHEFHEGLDLHASTGTSVFAAHDGVVIYAGHKIRGYGNLIVLRHKTGISTVYAHNSKILVRKGQTITLGQKIAVSGKSGRVSGPHLHFEVRDGTSAVDPLKVLPQQAGAAVSVR